MTDPAIIQELDLYRRERDSAVDHWRCFLAQQATNIASRSAILDLEPDEVLLVARRFEEARRGSSCDVITLSAASDPEPEREPRTIRREVVRDEHERIIAIEEVLQ